MNVFPRQTMNGWELLFLPYERPKAEPKPVAVVTKATGRLLEAETDAGPVRCRDGSLAKLEGFSVVCPLPAFQLRRYGENHAGSPWEELRMDGPGRLIWWRHRPSGLKVRPWRIAGHDLGPADLLALFRDLRATYGITATARSAVAQQSWQVTLADRLALGEEYVPATRCVGRETFAGGRKLAAVPEATDVMMLDMPHAYPAAMLAPLPTAIRRDRFWYRRPDPTDLPPDGFAAAQVAVPYMLHGPLGVVTNDVRRWPTATLLEGCWPTAELAAARQAGCDVRVTDVWVGVHHADLFGPWWRQVAQPLRRDHGVLGKMLSTLLWSQFAPARCDRVLRRFDGTEPQPVARPVFLDWWEPVVYLASTICARVRSRLFTEGLQAPVPVAYADTDGIVVPQGTTMPGWLPKREPMASFQTQGPGCFRYDAGAGWVYVVSGAIDQDHAAELYAAWTTQEPGYPGEIVDANELMEVPA